jgi:WD40 repeat protein
LIDPLKISPAGVLARARPHGETVSALTISTDGRYLVSAGTDRSIAVWNLAHPAPGLVRSNLAEPVIGLTSLTNVGIVTMLDAMHQLRWWSLDGAVALKSAALDPDSLVVPVISPDGHTIALGGDDRRQIRLHFDTTPPSSQIVAGLSSWAKLVRFSADSRFMAVLCLDDTVSLHQPASGNLVRRWDFADASLSDLAFSWDGRLLAAVGRDGTLRIRDALRGTVIADQPIPASGHSLAALETHGQTRFVIGSKSGIHLFLPSGDGPALQSISTSSPVTAVASLPDGTGFASGHLSGEVQVWEFHSEPSAQPARMARP